MITWGTISMGTKSLVAGLGCMALLAASARGQSPTSLAESANEYNAYVYSYNSKVTANGLGKAIKSGAEAEVAMIVSDYCDEGFFHCYDALVEDDDSLWVDAADDLEMALFWCDTLIVFAEDTQSNSVIGQIENLMWNLEIAISNAHAASPKFKRLREPVLTYPFTTRW